MSKEPKPQQITRYADEVSPGEITLKEFPGRQFQFSSVSTSAADMSARILGEHNNMTRSEVAEEVDRRRLDMRNYLNQAFAGGEARRHPEGAAQSSELIRAVILANGENINRELIDQGFGQTRSLRPAAHQEPHACAQGPRTHPAIHAWLSCSFSLTRTGSKGLSVLPYREDPDALSRSGGLFWNRSVSIFLFIHQGAIRGLDGRWADHCSLSLSVPLLAPRRPGGQLLYPSEQGDFLPSPDAGTHPKILSNSPSDLGMGFCTRSQGEHGFPYLRPTLLTLRSVKSALFTPVV